MLSLINIDYYQHIPYEPITKMHYKFIKNIVSMS